MFKLKNVLMMATAVSFIGGSLMACSTARDANAAYDVPDGPVEVYGHTLSPHKVEIPKNSDHAVYTWAQLKDRMPALLPDAQSMSKSAEEMCDHIVKMTTLYSDHVDQAQTPFIENAVPHFQGKSADLEISDRFASPAKGDLNKLLELFPGQEGQVMITKAETLNHLTLIFLHDAALKKCPDHAKEKKYMPITTYDGPDANYVPEACKQLDAPAYCD